MEYTMGTLITGNRNLRSLVGVTVHEFVHAWYEGAVANNETRDQWIDEGFTSYASAFITNHLFNNGEGDPMLSRYNGYVRMAQSGMEEPMHIHADHYVTNSAYGLASYTKGAIFLHQLGYVIGDDALKRSLNRFYEEWKFKHPTGYDFIRIAERESDMVLDWYYEYWVETTHTIDYSVKSVADKNGTANITLAKNGVMPMPLDVEIEFTDGSIKHYYIPLRIMWGQKENEFQEVERVVAEDWPWVFPEYELSIDRSADEITKVEIDPSGRMADVDRTNNVWEMSSNN
ncbi:MAG: M1 family aminopeptidase [Rhodohalobacter sp.]